MPALPKVEPPATRTRPSGSNVAVWPMREVLREPVALNLPVAGSYTCAAPIELVPSLPPTKSTRPSASLVVEAMPMSLTAGPVLVNLPVSGSYISGDVAAFPTIRTRPSRSSVAVPLSEVVIEPVGVKVPGAPGGAVDVGAGEGTALSGAALWGVALSGADAPALATTTLAPGD